jgi:hypothetical protein
VEWIVVGVLLAIAVAMGMAARCQWKLQAEVSGK